MKRVLLLAIITLLFIGCKKNSTTTEQNSFVSGLIKADTGGSLENGTGIKITFPADGLPKDAEVKIGIRGDEPSTVENTKLQVIGKPFTIVIPVDTLKKTALVEFSKPSGFTSIDEVAYFAFNGKTYMPLFYEIRNNKIEVKLDILNYVNKYNSTLGRGLNPTGELVIIGIVYKQTPPQNQMGLKQVSVGTNGKINYIDVGIISPNDKCLIFIHGWFSSPDTWEKFIPLFIPKSNVGYTKILTFGYNSSLPINDNGQSLANILSSKFQGMKVDIVGHSMGGLVSRSAIENYNASPYVKNLVTLGTPHKGSPLAALRYLLGILVALDGIPEYTAYNLNTQGIKDMFPLSGFITQLNSNPQPSVPYYAVAAENEFCNTYKTFIGVDFFICYPPSETILVGNDDGVVAKTSALGVIQNNNINLQTELYLPTFMAHTAIVQNEGFVNLVAGYLNNQNQSNPTNGLIAYYPFNGNANDESGNQQNGTIMNTPTFEPGVSGQSIKLIGRCTSGWCEGEAGDHVLIPIPQFDLMNSFSINIWVKEQSLLWPDGEAYISFGSDQGNIIQIGHYGNNLHFSSSSGSVIAVPFNAGNINTYQMYTLVYDNGVLKAYHNGNLAATLPNAVKGTSGNVSAIGRHWGISTYTRFNGNIDQVRIYNRALVSSEIGSLFSTQQ